MDYNKNIEEELRIATYSQKRLQNLLKPLLFSMKLFGVYHDKHDITRVNPETKTLKFSDLKTKTYNSFSCSRVYSFAVLILVWANLLRFAVALPPNDQHITERIIMFVWFGLVAVADLVMFISCEKMNHFSAFYKHWNKIYQDADYGIEESQDKCLYRAVLVGTVSGWICVVVKMLTVLYLDFWVETGYMETFIRPFPISAVTHILMLFMHLLVIGVYVFPMIFIAVMCYVVKSGFVKLLLVMKSHARLADHSFAMRLEKMRRIHLLLCRTVSVLDRSFRLLVVVEYVVNIPLACFIVYQLVKINNDIIKVVVDFFLAVSEYWYHRGHNLEL